MIISRAKRFDSVKPVTYNCENLCNAAKLFQSFPAAPIFISILWL